MPVTVNLTALAPRLEVVAVMQFITLVQIRAGGEPAETGSRVAARAAQWEHLKHQIQLVGGRVDQIWNVLGNDYDLMFLGEAEDPKTLHRIDAVCKAERSEEHTSELQSHLNLVCRLLLEKKK